MGDILFSYIKIYLIQYRVIFIKQIDLNSCRDETYGKILIHFSMPRFNTINWKVYILRYPFGTFHTLHLRAWSFDQSHSPYF